MLILHDPDTLLHDTVELLGAKAQPALESPSRIKAILESVGESEHTLKTISTSDRDEQEVLDLASLTHDPQYLRHYKTVHGEWVSAGIITLTENVLPECFAFQTNARSRPLCPKDIYARSGYYAFDMSSGVGADSWTSIIASANLAVKAVNQSLENNNDTVLALCRPPGHHCNGNKAGGYCYINNAAVAVEAFRKLHRRDDTKQKQVHLVNSTNNVDADTDFTRGDPRVAILDLDFHHGNGTQDIFYSDPLVFYASIHGEDEFPYYTGYADEQGSPSAPGANLNLPIPTKSPFDPVYLSALDTVLDAVEGFSPDFLVVSLGFDTFRLDPLGSFGVDTEDYERMARRVRKMLSSVATRSGGEGATVPVVILLEGGYVIERLGANLLSFLKGWEQGGER